MAQFDIDGALRSVDTLVDIGASEISGFNGNSSSGGGGLITFANLIWLLFGVIIHWRLRLDTT